MFSHLLYGFQWRRLIRFAIIGGFALAIDLAIYLTLTRFFHMPYILSRVTSLGIAIVWNFTLNRAWTFEATTESVRKQAPRFLFVLLCTSILNLALMKFGVSVLHIYDIVVIFIVSFLIMMINFSAHYLWSYKS